MRWVGIADSYLDAPDESNVSAYHVDKVSCIMAGFLPLAWAGESYTFDVKLWLWHETKQPKTCTSHDVHEFRAHASSVRSKSTVSPHISLLLYLAPVKMTRPTQVIQHAKTAFAVAYTVGAIVSSVSYLEMTQVNLANDLYWAKFNMTGAHAFTATWLNEWIVLGREALPLLIDKPLVQLDSNQVAVEGAFDQSVAMVPSVANFGAELQYTRLNVLDQAIAGLRATSGCDVPWIFTQYCYVDFNQRWELANSASRQARCKASMTANGAVFIESVLRNVDSCELESCWGDAFTSGIASEVQSTTQGQQWLQDTLSQVFVLSIADEIALWRAHNITTFDTQWQNFKRIGLINSYTISNLYGVSYPFNLQYQNTSFRLAKQATFIMYWGLANDFDAVAPNRSSSSSPSHPPLLLSGRSLVRSSPLYAFANTSLEAVLQLNGTLPPALSQIHQRFRHVIGPFGSIDMHFIACPKAAKHAVAIIFDMLNRVLGTNHDAKRDFYNITDPSSGITPAPKAWTDVNFVPVGGSPFCAEVPFAGQGSIAMGMVSFPSWEAQCKTFITWTLIAPTRRYLVTSVLLSNLTDVARICAQNVQYQAKCTDFVNETVSFVSTYLVDLVLLDLIEAATTAIRNTRVEMIQFGQTSADDPVELYRYRVLEDPFGGNEFAFFSWMYLIEWTLGLREVVSFQGDVGTMAILTEYTAPLQQQVDGAQTPVNYSIYMRSAVWYITLAMIAVTSLLLLYVFASHGQIEVSNLLELQRVGAIVWVGRPLLFLRGLTAIDLLSTAILELAFDGYMSTFRVGHPPWYKTVLAANEVTWMVAIVDDLAMPLTQGYTPYYATTNSILVWTITASLSYYWPVTHVVSLAQRCAIVQMDAQIVCTSGDIAIGHVSRLVTLAMLVLASKLVCFVAARILVRRRVANDVHIKSIFVYAGAKYLFELSKWMSCDVYYMDRMSAAMNGILTVQRHETMHALDIKLWRVFSVDLSDEASSIPNHHVLAAAYRRALPLISDE